MNFNTDIFYCFGNAPLHFRYPRVSPAAARHCIPQIFLCIGKRLKRRRLPSISLPKSGVQHDACDAARPRLHVECRFILVRFGPKQPLTLSQS
ncbi:hypothetical protein [Burkholderia multivorans]|uniref:hypothetical protein n=1 Tax=Burkholderia multivorans TaxID=87883 RepID=UPI0021BF5D8E|nr:hypothetical protein [Burkholderia multivorans]